jgi:hypothetical protein
MYELWGLIPRVAIPRACRPTIDTSETSLPAPENKNAIADICVL